ncbi:hypothetical protein LNKW23_48330 [Paralimibaculum aggregatum]|uniref:Tyr recombinase domain-containing protein n=1 Tax=Paralimibaculum aggregatum TaxID=3036245 RepID=A0ABQ6LU53_9RHOB|nr:site-specific integrase [Limibaculum sp. NKW23]GMG85610.1 hypothetical protein LNKW23_48330 [Limibaculum sp. NKW23]
MIPARSLPVAHWPEADRLAWTALTTPAGPLDEPGALAGLRPASLKTLAHAHGHWLAWVAAQDPAALDEAPAGRLTPARLAAWMEREAGLAAVSRRTLAEGALRVAAAIAPARDWTAQRRAIARQRHEAACAGSPRKRGRIVPPEVLVAAGLAHAAADGPGAPSTLAEARRRRDGIMVATLALLPLRRRSFNGLALGTSLHRVGSRLTISLGAGDLKAGNAWEAPVPDCLAGPLLGYVDAVRPWLMARGGAVHSRLWVGDRGAAYGDGHFSQRIAGITRRLLGVAIPPHFFRDAAATTLAHHSPDAARLTRAILGHTSFRTAEKHYRHARMIETGRAYAGLIGAIGDAS